MSRYAGQEPRRYNLTSQSFTISSIGVTSLNLNYNPGSPQSILVHVNGSFVRPNEAYGVVGKVLTFTYPLTLGDVVSVYYLGILNNSYPVATLNTSVQGAFSGLSLSANGTSDAVSISVRSICLKNALNQYTTSNLQTLTLSTSTTGINGLDTGALAANTWYYVFLISDGTDTFSLASLSATAPTLPGSYVYWARIGSFKTDSSANKYPLAFIQKGRSVQYVIAPGTNVTNYPVMASGVNGTLDGTTYTPVSVAVSAFVPTSASHIRVNLNSYASGQYAAVSPNSSSTIAGFNTATPPIFGADGSSVPSQSVVSLMLESTNIYYAGTGASNVLRCIGWEDNL